MDQCMRFIAVITERNEPSVKEIAEALDTSKRQVYRLIESYGLVRPIRLERGRVIAPSD